MAIYAQVENGKVTNTIVWDGSGNLSLPGDLVRIGDGDEPVAGMPGIGWDYVDGQFADNRPESEDL